MKSYELHYNTLSADSFMSDLTNDIYEIIKKKVNFGDALILKTAIDNRINTYVGWNIRHFKENLGANIRYPALC
jgi:hypothetical protein